MYYQIVYVFSNCLCIIKLFMYYQKLFAHVETFRKKAYGGCKSQLFVIGDKNAGRGVRVAEAGR